MAIPYWKHDCTACTFLGSALEGQEYWDLYYCDQGGKLPTVIARYGDEGSEYVSGMGHSAWFMVTAEALAKHKGLVK